MTDSEDIWAKEPDMDALRRAHGLLEVDPGNAVKELERLADRGSVMSMTYLGSAYRNGTGVAKSDAKSKRWYRRASDMGSVFALHEIGKIHLRRKEHKEAAQIFHQCSALQYSPSQYRLANLYLNGEGVTKDPATSRLLFQSAASSGNVFAQRALAVNLCKGSFGKREIIAGVKMYMAAISGSVKCVLTDPYSDKLRS